MSATNPLMSSALRMITVVALMTVLSSPLVRSATATNTFQVQTLIVVDQKGFQKWKTFTGKSTFDELKKEIVSNMVDVTDLYKGLQSFDPPLTIGFEIVDIVLRSDWYSGEYVKVVTALNYLETWTSSQTTKADITLLYTGYDLTSVGNSAHGVAWIEYMCTEKSLAILEIQGTYKDALTISHEIAHSLGSVHDEEPNATACHYSDGFIMANNINMETLNLNHFKFSQCTYELIYKNLVTEDDGKCLKDGDPNKLVKGLKGGEMFTADEMCMRRFGSNSRLDRAYYFSTSYDESICSKMKCVTSNPHEKYMLSNNAISCGKNKQCVMGHCIQTADGNPNTLDSCPLGDQSTPLDGKKLACDTLPDGACLNWNAECCQTCSDYKMSEADAACKRLQCPKSVFMRSKYENNWGDSLCQKLHCEGTYFYESVVHDTPEGMKCGKNKVCKNKKCVEGPGGDPNMPDECPYGDRPWIRNYEMNCTGFYGVYGCSHRAQGMCCETCPPLVDVRFIDKSADEVCKSVQGYEWALGRGLYQEYGDEFCAEPLNCVSSVDGEDGEKRLVRAQVPVPEGLICGKGKVCTNGQCRASSQGYNYVSDDCPWGDQQLTSIGLDQNSCAAQADRSTFCKKYKDWCCATCQ